jgi:hypothetical protein
MNSENPVNQEQPTPDAKDETNQDTTQAQPVISPTIGTTKPETPPPSEKCKQSCHEKKHWLDYLEAGMGGVGLFVLVVYTIFTGLMYCANKKAADAAKSAADTARDALVKSNRPWVGIDDQPVVVQIQEMNKGVWKFVVRYKVKNFGKDIALHIGFAGKVSESGTPETFKSEADTFCAIAENLTKPIYPGDKGTGPYIFPGNWINKQGGQIGARVDGSTKFDVIGCIVYSDQFNSPIHHTRFCFMSKSTIAKVRPNQILSPCLVNEDAD